MLSETADRFLYLVPTPTMLSNYGARASERAVLEFEVLLLKLVSALPASA